MKLPTKSTHPHPWIPCLGAQGWGPQIFPPKNQLRVFQMASMQGHPFRRENTMGLNYSKLLIYIYHQNFCQEMSKDGKMANFAVNSEGILREKLGASGCSSTFGLCTASAAACRRCRWRRKSSWFAGCSCVSPKAYSTKQ